MLTYRWAACLVVAFGEDRPARVALSMLKGEGGFGVVWIARSVAETGEILRISLGATGGAR
jgi:hypothetical protein